MKDWNGGERGRHFHSLISNGSVFKFHLLSYLSFYCHLHLSLSRSLPPLPSSPSLLTSFMKQVSAKALAALVEGMGEEHFPELLSWLVSQLKSPKGSVERSGGWCLMNRLCLMNRKIIKVLMCQV